MAAVDGQMQRPSDRSPEGRRFSTGKLVENGTWGGTRPPDRRRGLQKAVNGGPLSEGEDTLNDPKGPRDFKRPRPPSPQRGV